MSLPPVASDPLLTALRKTLAAQGSPHAAAPLTRLRDKGLAHEHVRLGDSGLLARIPKQSQMRLDAARNLAYQAACFERAGPGGHVPRLHAVLPPSPALPRGALLVEEIVGRPAALPQDLGAIVRALASLHALPLPAPADRAPLLDAADPLADLHAEIARQARFLQSAGVAPAVAGAVETGLAQLQALCGASERPPRHLIAFDGHPGNFVLRAGRAILVDLEKCRYSYPALDLAHATLYTSTTWDLETHAVLDGPQVVQAYADWAQAVGAGAAGAARPWHLPLRRAMWLWSLTWCAQWRVASAGEGAAGTDGEDGSVAQSDAALVAHVRGRVDHYLDEAVVARQAAEFGQLEQALAP